MSVMNAAPPDSKPRARRLLPIALVATAVIALVALGLAVRPPSPIEPVFERFEALAAHKEASFRAAMLGYEARLEAFQEAQTARDAEAQRAYAEKARAMEAAFEGRVRALEEAAARRAQALRDGSD